jgi:peptidoglycan/xylan/chitin deacetylase (PgdA/CDA1 family)
VSAYPATGTTGALVAIAVVASTAAAPPAASVGSSVAVAAARIRRVKRSKAVPILMYHQIEQRPATRPNNTGVYVNPPDFAAQMRYLASSGYRAVSLGRVYDYWDGRASLPSKPIVITFDDGYLSQLNNALPVLRSLGWRGSLNLTLRPNRSDRLSTEMVRTLVQAGWEVNSHTLTHPWLPALSDDALQHELVDSKREIQSRFHVAVRFFCYPFGGFNARVIRALKRAGYLAALTTRFGLAEPLHLFRLQRIKVTYDDGVDGLRQKLTAARAREGWKVSAPRKAHV